tara:strand:- start:555 stop:887 length:333 start_codon:yes stop_codon:yes gene_type:complete
MRVRKKLGGFIKLEIKKKSFLDFHDTIKRLELRNQSNELIQGVDAVENTHIVTLWKEFLIMNKLLNLSDLEKSFAKKEFTINPLVFHSTLEEFFSGEKSVDSTETIEFTN